MEIQLERAKQKRHNLKEELKLKEIELNGLKGELKSYTNLLLKHYHELLNEGLDTRYFIYFDKFYKTRRTYLGYKSNK